MAKNKKKTISIDKKIENVKKEMKRLVKERGMFENSKAGRKIDTILDDNFIKEMRGNGTPSILEKMRKNTDDHEEFERARKEIEGNGGIGLCERYRAHRKIMRIQWCVIAFLVYLALGGSFRGITWGIIKENLGITVKTEQVEQAPVVEKLVVIIEENKPEVVVPLPVEPEEIIEEIPQKDVINKEE